MLKTKIDELEKKVKELMGELDKTTNPAVLQELLDKLSELQQVNPKNHEKYEAMKKVVARTRANFAGRLLMKK